MHHVPKNKATHPAYETLIDIPLDTCPTCRTLRVIVNDMRAEKRAWMAERDRLERQIAHLRAEFVVPKTRWWRR